MQAVDEPAQTPGTAAPATTKTQSIPHVTTAGAPSLVAPRTAAKPAPIAPAATGGPAKPVMSEASHPTGAGVTAPGAGKAAATAVAAKGAGAATPAGAAVVPAAAPAAAAAGPDTGQRSISVTQRGVKGEVSLNREVFSYDAGERRDPFVSLMRNGDLRPMLSDLRLVTVLYDATGRNSVAIMHDQSTKDQYRVRVGMTLGRMRIAQIEPKSVVFTIEEVGFSRQEALALGDSTKARKQ
jgi:hypothetical protein